MEAWEFHASTRAGSSGMVQTTSLAVDQHVIESRQPCCSIFESEATSNQ